MPSDFPRSPRLLKGALVVFGASVPIPTNLIVFQSNPDSMTRGFEQQIDEEDPRRSAGDTRAVRAPLETFQVTVELDATDQLETNNPLARVSGLHPTLAALELLLYPPSTLLIANKLLALAGTAMVSPPQAPLVLLVWGPLRVAPVRVTSLSIAEEAFDQALNPIRAKVQLGMRTLTERELSRAGPPFDTLALVQQIGKEVLARTNIVNSAQEVAGMLPF